MYIIYQPQTLASISRSQTLQSLYAVGGCVYWNHFSRILCRVKFRSRNWNCFLEFIKCYNASNLPYHQNRQARHKVGDTMGLDIWASFKMTSVNFFVQQKILDDVHRQVFFVFIIYIIYIFIFCIYHHVFIIAQQKWCDLRSGETLGRHGIVKALNYTASLTSGGSVWTYVSMWCPPA